MKFKPKIGSFYVDDKPYLVVLSYPLAFVIAYFCTKIPFLKSFLTMFTVWIHEFGHAIQAWLGGIKATPLGFGVMGITFSGEEKSLWVYCCFNFLLSYVLYKSYRKQFYFLVGLSLFLILCSFRYYFFIDEIFMREKIVAGGFYGAIIISAVLMMSFYHKMPDVFLWSLTRYFVLIIACFSLLNSAMDWQAYFNTKTLFHFGCNYEEAGVGGLDGDLFVLENHFSWGLRKFTVYFKSALYTAFSLVILQYIVRLRELKRKI